MGVFEKGGPPLKTLEVCEGHKEFLEVLIQDHMGGCQNCGTFLDPYYNTAPNI